MTFSGSVISKLLFPRHFFKAMLQKIIKVLTWDASWVSSYPDISLVSLGFREFIPILGQDNATDQSGIMQEQMSGDTKTVPRDQQSFQDRVVSFGADRSSVGTR